MQKDLQENQKPEEVIKIRDEIAYLDDVIFSVNESLLNLRKEMDKKKTFFSYVDFESLVIGIIFFLGFIFVLGFLPSLGIAVGVGFLFYAFNKGKIYDMIGNKKTYKKKKSNEEMFEEQITILMNLSKRKIFLQEKEIEVLNL